MSFLGCGCRFHGHLFLALIRPTPKKVKNAGVLNGCAEIGDYVSRDFT